MRPALPGKGRKMAGNLEAHVNGFRYRTPKGEEVDVMYRYVVHNLSSSKDFIVLSSPHSFAETLNMHFFNQLRTT